MTKNPKSKPQSPPRNAEAKAVVEWAYRNLRQNKGEQFPFACQFQFQPARTVKLVTRDETTKLFSVAEIRERIEELKKLATDTGEQAEKISALDNPANANRLVESLGGVAKRANELLLQLARNGNQKAVEQLAFRALAVAGDKVIGLAGLIQPGNFVDILVTVQDPLNDKLHLTKIVLENIRVLATGTMIDNKGDNTKPAPVDVFTVEVTPQEGQELSLASSQGKLHFALRNVTDKNPALTLASTVPELLEAYRPQMQKVSGPAGEATDKRVSKMFVINGPKNAIEWVSF